MMNLPLSAAEMHENWDHLVNVQNTEYFLDREMNQCVYGIAGRKVSKDLETIYISTEKEACFNS